MLFSAAALMLLVALIVTIVSIAKYGSPGLVIPSEPGQENLEGQRPQMSVFILLQINDLYY